MRSPAGSASSRLTVVVVDNHVLDTTGRAGSSARFELEGWSAVRADGRDHDALERAFAATGERPHVVIAEVSR